MTVTARAKLEQLRTELLETEESRLPKGDARHDEIHPRLLSIMRGCVGQPYDAERQTALLAEAQRRYDTRIPPGYLDAKKSGENAAGDFLLWSQVLDHAESNSQAIILVTDDTKEDWFWRVSGRTIGPRPELVRELWARAEVPLLLYTPSQFMASVSEASKTTIDPAVLEEAKAREIARRRPPRAPTPPDPTSPLRLMSLRPNVHSETSEVTLKLFVIPAGAPGQVDCSILDPDEDLFVWEGTSPSSGIVTLEFPNDLSYMSSKPDEPIASGKYQVRWTFRSDDDRGTATATAQFTLA
jgi:hypothetical protein